MHVLHVVGARPNFMKAAPVMRALSGHFDVAQTLVHTGQHYDPNMSDLFFQDLEMPAPDINLRVRTGSHAQQTALIMSSFEPVLVEKKPDILVVYGDVNSTLAAALVASKLNVPVVHVEAGLRSFDRTMPEEVNRILVDHLASVLFTPSADADENLVNEGIRREKIHMVGNVMIDTLVRLLPRAAQRTLADLPDRYYLVTMHRAANVDDPAFMGEMLKLLNEVAEHTPVLFPVHPRTASRLRDFGLTAGNVRFLGPLSYLAFLALQMRASAVITDSGGIQEETTFLGVPCLTIRENTERPVTITMGTNKLVGRNMDKFRAELAAISTSSPQTGRIPPLWDGNAGTRIAEILVRQVKHHNQSSCEGQLLAELGKHDAVGLSSASDN